MKGTKLGNYLKNYRVSHNMTQVQFAEKIGITQTTYSFIESGSNRNLSFGVVNKIAEVLELKPEEVRAML